MICDICGRDGGQKISFKIPDPKARKGWKEVEAMKCCAKCIDTEAYNKKMMMHCQKIKVEQGASTAGVAQISEEDFNKSKGKFALVKQE